MGLQKINNGCLFGVCVLLAGCNFSSHHRDDFQTAVLVGSDMTEEKCAPSAWRSAFSEQVKSGEIRISNRIRIEYVSHVYLIDRALIISVSMNESEIVYSVTISTCNAPDADGETRGKPGSTAIISNPIILHENVKNQLVNTEKAKGILSRYLHGGDHAHDDRNEFCDVLWSYIDKNGTFFTGSYLASTLFDIDRFFIETGTDETGEHSIH